MRFERTDWNDPRFLAIIKQLDGELSAMYGELMNFYNKKNVIAGNAHVVLCLSEDRVLGCGCLRILEDGQTVELKRMFTVPEERGRGIGTGIIAELELWARELRKRDMILETGIKQIEAIGLYKKLGFHVIENYGEYKGNANSICMAKTIATGGRA